MNNIFPTMWAPRKSFLTVRCLMIPLALEASRIRNTVKWPSVWWSLKQRLHAISFGENSLATTSKPCMSTHLGKTMPEEVTRTILVYSYLFSPPACINALRILYTFSIFVAGTSGCENFPALYFFKDSWSNITSDLMLSLLTRTGYLGVVITFSVLKCRF
jgi:hypothetical protein